MKLIQYPFAVEVEFQSSGHFKSHLFPELVRVLEESVTDERKEQLKHTHTVFIGHGGDRQWEALRKAISKAGYEVEAFETHDRLGSSTLYQVLSMVQKSSVAVIVMSAVDELKSGSKQARPNVVHEIGIAHGILGPENTIIMKEDTAEEFSNIAGITQIRYQTGEIHTVEDEVLAGIEYRLNNVTQHMGGRYYGHYGR